MKILKITFFAALTALFYSCSSDLESPIAQESELDAVTVKTIVNTSELSGFADGILTEIFNSGLSGKSGKSGKLNDCYTSETTGQTTTITFTNCTIEGNEAVNGVISATYIIDGNAVGLRIVYTNLTVGESQISGTRDLFFGETNQTGQSSITIDSDIQVVLEDDTIVLEKGSKIVWYDSTSTENQSIAIDGEWTVTTNGKSFDVVIVENLETVLPCEYISKGLMTIAEGDASASLDFGDGTCDNLALFTYPNGNTEEITLKD